MTKRYCQKDKAAVLGRKINTCPICNQKTAKMTRELVEIQKVVINN